jgi:hypothetical protein
VPTVSDRVDNLLVESKVGTRRQRDHFQVSDTPLHAVTVENRNGEECDVEVELDATSSILLIEGTAPPWRSTRMTHGGLRSRGKREWPYHATLSFTGVDPRRLQIIQVKVYMAAAWWPDDEPLPLVGEIRHAIWIE